MESDSTAAGAIRRTDGPPRARGGHAGDPAGGRGAKWMILGALLPGMLLAALAMASRLGFRPYHDEKLYLPVSIDFGRDLSFHRFIRYDGIRVITGPLIFVVYGAWLRLVSGGAVAARILSVILASVAGVFFVAIGRRSGVARPVLLAAGLAVLPLYLLTGLAFLSESLALSSGLLGLWLWIRGVDRGWAWGPWLAAVPLAVATDIRLPMIAMPVSLGLAGAVVVRRRSAAIGPWLAIAAQAPLWAAWGGLLPPARDVDAPQGLPIGAGLHVETLLHMITIVGFLFWPALRRTRAPVAIAWSLLGLALYWAWSPDMSPRFAGPLRALTSILGRWPGRALLGAAFLAGWNLAAQVALQALDPSRPAPSRSLGLLALAALGIYTVSPLAFDRYSLTFTPFWLLATAPTLEAGPGRWAWAAWMVGLTGMACVSLAILFGAITMAQ